MHCGQYPDIKLDYATIYSIFIDYLSMRSPTELLSDAIALYKAHAKQFFLIYLIPALAAVAFSLYFGDVEGREGMESVIAVPFALLLAVVNIFMGIAMIKFISEPETTSVQSAYGFAKHMFWRYLWVTILAVLCIIGGLILLIIPGIIFSVWFSFSYYVALLEDKRGADALRASKAYVKGIFWKVFGRLFFVIFITLVVAFAFGFVMGLLGQGEEGNKIAIVVQQLLGFVIVPITVAYTYYLYLDVRSRTTPQSEPVNEVSAAESETPDTV